MSKIRLYQCPDCDRYRLTIEDKVIEDGLLLITERYGACDYCNSYISDMEEIKYIESTQDCISIDWNPQEAPGLEAPSARR